MRPAKLVAAFSLLAVSAFAAVPSDASANAPLLELGDSIAAGLCLANPPAQQFGYLVGAHLGVPVTDKGVNGYQADTIAARELGAPQAPLVEGKYGTVIIVAGSNDMINLWKTYPNYYTSIATLAGRHIALIEAVHAIEPHAKIVDVGVRDLGYNDARISTADKAAYAQQIEEYDDSIATWIAGRTYVKYFPIFPERSFPHFYEAANICGPWHPSAAAEPLFATGIEALLDQIPAQ